MEQQSKIELLRFPDNVRVNPYQLLGPCTDASLLYREILDNGRDELIASKSCNTLWLKTDGDFHIVADNGRGINIALSDDGRTQLELAVGEIYAGGKYHKDVISSGMHGIGSSAVNAVSDVFKVACKITEENYSKSTSEVKSFIESNYLQNYKIERRSDHTGYYLLLEYHKGIKVREVVISNDDLAREFSEGVPFWMSTIVGFTSDPTIVKSNKVEFKEEWVEYTSFILNRFYNKSIHIILNGAEIHNELKPFKYEFEKTIKLAHPDWAEVNEEVQVYVSFEFDKDLEVRYESGCVNMISVYDGVHIKFARNAITRVLKNKYNIEHNTLLPGLKFFVILLAKKVGYDSQTKVRLVSIDGWSWDDEYSVDDDIWTILDNDKEVVDEHVQALNELAATYQSISARQYIEQMVNISTSVGSGRSKSFQPIKLIDASAPDSDRGECELFICEGESAKGTLMKVRDPYYHAVMPLKGVSMNVSWKTIEEAFENEEVCDIISAIGTGVDDLYDMEALRYDKIIIAADADSDGLHISALLLGLFASFMRFLVEKGHVYVLQSPLYKQDGKFLYDNSELDKNKPFERYKGLGSMHATTVEGRKEIEDVFTNPDTRHLIKVTPEKMDLAVMTLGDKWTRKILMQSRNLVATKKIEDE